MSQYRPRYRVWIIALVVLALLALAFYFFLSPSQHFAKLKQKEPPVFVSIAKVKTQNWPTEVVGTGSTIAIQAVKIMPQSQGRITKITFDSGQTVKKGALLVSLYNAPLKAQLANAKAQVVLAKGKFERQTKLFKQHYTNQEAYDEAHAAYKQALAQVKNLQAQLDETLIRAPFSGLLGLRQVDLGQSVDANTVITQLTALDPMAVEFSVPAYNLPMLRKGEVAIVHSAALPGRKIKAVVYAIDSTVDPDTRMIALRAEFRNTQARLLPGMFVKVALELSKKNRYVTVPQQAVSYSPQGAYLYRAVKGKAVLTYVTLGQRRGKAIAVIKGLKPGAQVVVSGALKLHDGAPIKNAK